jgi:glutathione gamma-glutamylcysteinyltransferase
MTETFYKRPLPPGLVGFTSEEGRDLLCQSMGSGDAAAFFPLVAHLHTQSEPAWCGFGTLVTVLNALDIDPGRTWRGPWRFFGEELLVCCKSLEEAAADGLTLAEVACLAQCNGAHTRIENATAGGLPAFRETMLASVRAHHGPFVVANYDRATLGQTGTGHFSPLAAWHAASDQVLVLDVARFKYPPHWVPVPLLWQAMCTLDGATQESRGYLTIDKASEPLRPEGLAVLLTHLQTMGAHLCPPDQSDC